jgi:hypothetical protein
MIFGNPAVQYARTVLHKNALIHRATCGGAGVD